MSLVCVPRNRRAGQLKTCRWTRTCLCTPFGGVSDAPAKVAMSTQCSTPKLSLTGIAEYSPGAVYPLSNPTQESAGEPTTLASDCDDQAYRQRSIRIPRTLVILVSLEHLKLGKIRENLDAVLKNRGASRGSAKAILKMLQCLQAGSCVQAAVVAPSRSV